MAEDLFNVMCRESPNLQDALKDREDLDYCFEHKDYRPFKACYCKPIKRPRQEDLQELYAEYFAKKGCKLTPFRIITVFHDFVNYIEYDYHKDFTGSSYSQIPKVSKKLTLKLIERYKLIGEKYKEWHKAKSWSVLWLLFVHKMLWNQTWNFENKKWEGEG